MTRAGVLGAAVAAASGLLVAPALAGDPACVWNGLAPASRTAFLARYDQVGAGALRGQAFPGQDLGRAVLSCGVPANRERVRAAGTALSGYALAQAAERALSRDHALPADLLTRTWTGLPAASRAVLVRASSGLDAHSADRTAAQATIRQFVQTVERGRTVPAAQLPTFRQRAANWAVGKAVAEAHAANF